MSSTTEKRPTQWKFSKAWRLAYINDLGMYLVTNGKGKYGCLECGMHPLTAKEADEHDCK